MKIDQANKRENFVLRNDAPIRIPKMSENVCVHTFASILISNLDFLKKSDKQKVHVIVVETNAKNSLSLYFYSLLPASNSRNYQAM